MGVVSRLVVDRADAFPGMESAAVPPRNHRCFCTGAGKASTLFQYSGG